jgi:hypothetical protein
MEDNWYAIQQQIHDRINEARAIARAEAVKRAVAPSHPGRYAIGMALIRLGGWVLASGAQVPLDFTRALATLRTVAHRSLRA